MANLKLQANYRSDMSKHRMKTIRREGYATGSVFGHNAEPIPVEVRLADLAHQVKHSEAGIKSLIDLKIEGAPTKSDGTVIIKGIYKDPLTRKVLDIQFQRISMKEKVHVGVPMLLTGEAPGARAGGIVEQIVDELQVSCLPGDIPPKIEVDIGELEVGNLVRVKDLRVPDGIEVLMDPETVVVNCRPPHVAAVKEEVEEAEEAEEATEAPAEGETAQE